jgi:hypothetical protein
MTVRNAMNRDVSSRASRLDGDADGIAIGTFSRERRKMSLRWTMRWMRRRMIAS